MAAMTLGDRSHATEIVYFTFIHFHSATGRRDPVDLFHTALAEQPASHRAHIEPRSNQAESYEGC